MPVGWTWLLTTVNALFTYHLIHTVLQGRRGGSGPHLFNKRGNWIIGKRGSGGWAKKGTLSVPLRGLSFWPPNLEQQKDPWGQNNKGHDAPDPHLEILRPLSPRASRKARRRGGGVRRGGVRCRQRARKPASHTYVHKIPCPPLLPQLSPSSSHSKSARNCPAVCLLCLGTSRSKARSLVTRQLPPPHSKFAAALTHWLARRLSREAPAQPPTQAESRPAGRPHVTHSAENPHPGIHRPFHGSADPVVWLCRAAGTSLLWVVGFKRRSQSQSSRGGYFRALKSFLFL